MIIWGNTIGDISVVTDFNQTDPENPGYLAGRADLIALVDKAKEAGDNAQTTANEANAAAAAAQTRAENAETNAKNYAKDYADSRHINGEITLTPSGWSNNMQTVSFPGVTSDTSKTDIYASPRPEDDNYAAYVENGVRPYSQGDGTITFKCEDVPSVNVAVNVSVDFVGIIPDLGDFAMWEGGRY